MADILTLLRSKPGFVSLTGAEEDRILEAESALGLTFSTDYRDYLANFGAVSFEGHELTGIAKSPRLNVVSVTMDEKEKHQDIPADWYVIEQLHIDDVSIWQAGDGAIYQVLPTGNAIKVSNSFESYIEH